MAKYNKCSTPSSLACTRLKISTLTCLNSDRFLPHLIDKKKLKIYITKFKHQKSITYLIIKLSKNKIKNHHSLLRLMHENRMELKPIAPNYTLNNWIILLDSLQLIKA